MSIFYPSLVASRLQRPLESYRGANVSCGGMGKVSSLRTLRVLSGAFSNLSITLIAPTISSILPCKLLTTLY